MKTLQIIRELFDFMNDNIPYCHWKSIEHLDKTLSGDEDIDVLIDRRYKNQFIAELNKIGFVRFEIPHLKDYVAIEDYLGLDKATGKIIHLHLHYQLTLGEKYLKGNRIPAEQLLIKTRKYLQKEEVFVVDENLEAILFVVRFVLKMRIRDIIKGIIRVKYIRSSALREHIWLKERVSKDKIYRYAEELYDPVIANKIVDTFYSEMSVIKLSSLKQHMKNYLKINALYTKPKAIFEGYRREFFKIIEYLNKNFFDVSFYSRRRLFSGGLLVAIIGIDGAGKSSIVKKIRSDFSKEMNTYYEYLGSGMGKSSILRYPLKQLHRLLIFLRLWNPQNGHDFLAQKEHAKQTKSEEMIKYFGDLPWTLFLTMERKNKLKKIMANRNKGFLVLTDRYPQDSVALYHDGRRLVKENRGRIYNKIQKFERDVFNLYVKHVPDLIIRLLVDPEVAYNRKPHEITIDYSREAQKLLMDATYGYAEIIDVYNNGTFDDAVKEVKQIIWERL